MFRENFYSCSLFVVCLTAACRGVPGEKEGYEKESSLAMGWVVTDEI